MNKSFNLIGEEIKSLTKGKKLKIAGYANTTSKDRTKDIIVPEAWVHGVKNFRKNPVLLYQHNRSDAIGRVSKVTVDRNGLYIEAEISSAKQEIQTLIKDGALKAFSVGFLPKKVSYDRKTDTNFIKSLDLFEISVVSVPANQDSLFSIRKSFDTDEEYKDFIKEIIDEEENFETSFKAGIGSSENDSKNIFHYHSFEVDENGDGVSTYSSNGVTHKHAVINFEVQEEEGHIHSIKDWKDSTRPSMKAANNAESKEIVLMDEDEIVDEEVKEVKEVKKEEEVTKEVTTEEVNKVEAEEEEVEDYSKEIPFVNLLDADTCKIKQGDNLVISGNRFTVKKIATVDDPNFKLQEISLDNENLDNEISIKGSSLGLVNRWDLETDYDISVIEHKEIKNLKDQDRKSIRDRFDNLINMSTIDLYSVKDQGDTNQKILNTTINLVSSKNWSDADYKLANRYCDTVEALLEMNESDSRNKNLISYGHKVANKEKKEMAEQLIDDVEVINTSNKSQDESVKTQDTSTVDTAKSDASTKIEVLGDRIAELLKTLEETGKKNDDNVVIREDYSLDEKVKELEQQVKKNAERAQAYQNDKLAYESQTAKSQYSNIQLANLYLYAKAKELPDTEKLFDTKHTSKLKAVTTVDAFLSNFSTTIFEEMEQQLIIAPMLERFEVDARTFRVPVADEDTDGDVAQFASGTFATGAYDTTRVPVSNQHSFGAVEFTPHKFMAATHLSKDEQEDTIMPLMDFLRRSAARRMARAIDKALLRGDGSLSGFTASPTNAITAGSGYASVIKGMVTHANDIAGLRVDTGATQQVSPADIASARAKLGKYGLMLGQDLVFLTTIEGYNELVQTSDFRTVDKIGTNATYLTGSVGAVYGIPIVVTEFLDNTGSSDEQIGALIYKPGFKIAERRAMQVESEYKPRTEVTALYFSTRWDMKPLTTAGTASAPALNATNYSFASVVRSA